MKKNLIMMMAVIAMFAVGCSKDKTEPPQEPQQTISGYYTGKRNFDPASNEFPNNYNILFRSNGTARVFALGNGTDTAALLSAAKVEGTWLQNGSSVQVNYVLIGKSVTVTATVNKAATDVNGTLAYDGATQGKMSISKK